jgi:DNA-nicking Smr family endonuclease
MGAENCSENAGEPFQIPIEGELDLHTFNPRDIKDLLPEYLSACREKGIYQVRVVHGKGMGHLRRTVHAILSRLPEVASFSLAGEQFGGWGATIVNLRPPVKG